MAFDLHAALEGISRRPAERRRLVVLTHDNPDPDSIATALGLEAVVATAGVHTTIALGGIIGRAENRALVRELGITLVPVETLRWSDYDLVALVDTQPGTGNNSLPAERPCDIVIDHHPIRPASTTVPWCDVREHHGASMMIVHDYLRQLALPLDARLATAFLYALKSETRDLGREAGAEERAAYVEFYQRADTKRMHAIASPKLGREHFAAVDRALRAAEVRGKLVSASLGRLEYPDLVAEVADMLLPYEAAEWVLCVGHYEGAVYLSVRTDDPDAHAGELTRRVIGTRGAGGGHGMTAGGRIHEPVDSDDEMKPIYARLVKRMAEALDIDATPRPLL